MLGSSKVPNGSLIALIEDLRDRLERDLRNPERSELVQSRMNRIKDNADKRLKERGVVSPDPVTPPGPM